ncbi:hypothetical protein PsYK624_109340 [Phanerochaete sordida]|uniref:Uncharacterized protein n=1 Tax=Phanerochaete sordida TaxID=48140 RepID=A0A9P3GFL0_9APHY|nr:hypothetical protein PsYK624_109340 [Phanerochaete sordida]
MQSNPPPPPPTPGVGTGNLLQLKTAVIKIAELEDNVRTYQDELEQAKKRDKLLKMKCDGLEKILESFSNRIAHLEGLLGVLATEPGHSSAQDEASASQTEAHAANENAPNTTGSQAEDATAAQVARALLSKEAKGSAEIKVSCIYAEELTINLHICTQLVITKALCTLQGVRKLGAKSLPQFPENDADWPLDSTTQKKLMRFRWTPTSTPEDDPHNAKNIDDTLTYIRSNGAGAVPEAGPTLQIISNADLRERIVSRLGTMNKAMKSLLPGAGGRPSGKLTVGKVAAAESVEDGTQEEGEGTGTVELQEIHLAKTAWKNSRALKVQVYAPCPCSPAHSVDFPGPGAAHSQAQDVRLHGPSGKSLFAIPVSQRYVPRRLTRPVHTRAQYPDHSVPIIPSGRWSGYTRPCETMRHRVLINLDARHTLELDHYRLSRLKSTRDFRNRM